MENEESSKKKSGRFEMGDYRIFVSGGSTVFNGDPAMQKHRNVVAGVIYSHIVSNFEVS